MIDDEGDLQAFFDAYALAALRDHDLWAAAFALPAVFFEPGRTVVCTTRVELGVRLAARRASLVARGVVRLEWVSLDARTWGDRQREVAVQWERHGARGTLDVVDRLYLLRGVGGQTSITGVLGTDDGSRSAAPPAGWPGRGR